MSFVAEDRPILAVSDVVGGYGDLKVLRGVSVAARCGQVTTVLGRNGAGKSSLLKAITGFLPAIDSGSIVLDGRDIGRMASSNRTRAGLGFVQENKRIFRRRTVEQNLLLGGYTLKRPWFGRGMAIRYALEEAYTRFPILAEHRRRLAGRLSGGQQQMLAIAQALMAKPKVLLLDEPCAGLAPAILGDVFDMIRRLKEEGLAIVLVEQVVEEALAVADNVVVLESGRVAASGPVAEFNDAAVVRAVYMGRRGAPEHAGGVVRPSLT